MIENIIDKVPAPKMPNNTVKALAAGLLDISNTSLNPIVETVMKVM